jgi:hypothetical protein
MNRFREWRTIGKESRKKRKADFGKAGSFALSVVTESCCGSK